jgi:hypothetical protein
MTMNKSVSRNSRSCNLISGVAPDRRRGRRHGIGLLGQQRTPLGSGRGITVAKRQMAVRSSAPVLLDHICSCWWDRLTHHDSNDALRYSLTL